MRAIDAQYGPTRHVFKTVFLFDTSFNSFMSLTFSLFIDIVYGDDTLPTQDIQAVGDWLDPELSYDPNQEPVPTLNPI